MLLPPEILNLIFSKYNKPSWVKWFPNLISNENKVKMMNPYNVINENDLSEVKRLSKIITFTGWYIRHSAELGYFDISKWLYENVESCKVSYRDLTPYYRYDNHTFPIFFHLVKSDIPPLIYIEIMTIIINKIWYSYQMISDVTKSYQYDNKLYIDKYLKLLFENNPYEITLSQITQNTWFESNTIVFNKMEIGLKRIKNAGYKFNEIPDTLYIKNLKKFVWYSPTMAINADKIIEILK